MIGNAMRGFQMDLISIIGLVAGAITVASFFPQLMKAWRTKSTKDI
jgi:MtN3 and saliva related transmembrane protein